MEIIEGFTHAELALSRRDAADFSRVSPALRKKLEAMFATGDPEAVVKQIIGEVRSRGDKALIELTAKIDGVKLASLEVSKEQVAVAYKEIAPELVSALKLAAERIRAFHEKQRDSLGKGFSLPGVAQVLRPLERVGVYAPGGLAAYPSTVLMTAIPARVAGVGEVVLTTSPRAAGLVPPATLVAADIAGVDRVFGIGGAQAIGALAYGTESVPKVDKVCGPGNIFVVIAKRLVYGVVDIDGLPGPSEILIVADDTADPEYCAADLLAQAEHDPLASAVLVTTSTRLASEVTSVIERQLEDLPTRATAAESLRDRGKIVVVADINEAIALANLYAPEHLSLMVAGAADYADRITSAGCVFIGGGSTVVLGDYVAGPSHVLPTGGTARYGSPLGVSDFIKSMNLVNIDRADLSELGWAAAIIARAEGFEAHARAVEKRLKDR
ncbi:MAG: histidinol dehydrogenase [Dehalococcoidales bacterium]|nr:histidinol dehydrogenase [Dehalococcoidales bacterium]